MNTVDIAIVVVFLGVFTAAFFAGIGRSLAGVISLGAATLIAAVFYKAVGAVLIHLFIPIDPVIARLAAFLLLMLVGGIGVDYLLLRSFRVSRLRTRFAHELSGGVPSIIALTLLSVLLAVCMVTLLTQISNNTVEQLPDAWGTEWLVSEYRGSSFAEQTLRLSPYLYRPISLLTPGLSPSILDPQATVNVEFGDAATD